MSKLDAFKVRFFKSWIVIKSTVAVIVGGAGSALTAHFADPTDLKFDAAGLAKLKGIAAGGAAIALFHLFQNAPHKD